MTINELLALAGLTASDEIPVWDAEGQVNGRTKKITAQNLAASIKTIASLIASSDLDTTPTSGSTKAVQSGGVYDAIQQSTANKVVQGTISNAKISDTVRSSTVPVGISVWQTQTATDSPVTGNVSMAMIIKPTASGQFSVCALFATGHVYMSNQLGASGDFVWTTL